MTINFAIEYYMFILLIGFMLIYVFKNEPTIVFKKKNTNCNGLCSE